MNAWTRMVVMTCLVALAVGGCKDGDEQEKLAEAKKKAASEAVATESVEAAPAAEVKKFSEEALKKFAVMDVPDFDRTEDGMIAAGGVSPWYVGKNANANGIKIEAWINIGNCPMQCLEFSKEVLEQKKRELPEWLLMSKAHRENPKLIYEIGQDEVEGTKVLTTYVFSYAESKTASGTSRSGKHSLALYYNDGTRQLRVAVSGKNVSPKSEEELKTKITRGELTTTAKKFFQIFFTEF